MVSFMMTQCSIVKLYVTMWHKSCKITIKNESNVQCHAVLSQWSKVFFINARPHDTICVSIHTKYYILCMVSALIFRNSYWLSFRKVIVPLKSKLTADILRNWRNKWSTFTNCGLVDISMLHDNLSVSYIGLSFMQIIAHFPGSLLLKSINFNLSMER